MSKFNRVGVRPARGHGPVAVAEATPTVVTHEGAPAYARDARSDLFMLAVTNMVGEDTFYETADVRDARYRALVRQVAVEDPVWLARMLRWLRASGNMRSASLVGAAEMVQARIDLAGAQTHEDEIREWGLGRGVDRAVIDAVCQRPDEPSELLAYWFATYGRQIPKPVKRGLADAARRLYNERAVLKYDTDRRVVRFADVIEMTRPAPAAGWQADLFRYAIERRHGRDTAAPDALTVVQGQASLRRAAATDPTVLLNPDQLRAAGMTWEDVLSLAGKNVDRKALWEALVPLMGIMALARNLRNFDEAGVSDEVAGEVLARFADRDAVLRSRMFPFRWLSAYESAPSLRWGHALDQAATVATSTIPALTGRSLVLIDTSASMTTKGISAKSTVTPLKAGALFGVALALHGAADVYGFADGVFVHKVPAGASLIRTTSDLVKRSGEVGHGTQIAAALHRTYRDHDRVFIVSDMQTMPYVDGYNTALGRFGSHGDVARAVPVNVPVYAFNLGGYAATPLDLSRPGRVELGGMTDATFQLVPLIEAGQRADWPF